MLSFVDIGFVVGFYRRVVSIEMGYFWCVFIRLLIYSMSKFMVMSKKYLLGGFQHMEFISKM